MKKLSAAILCLALLAGCSSDELPPEKFAATPSKKIVLNVAQIEVVDHSDFQPSDSPYNKYHLTPTVAQVIRQWIKDSLRAGGTTGKATILIQDASLSARALPTSDELMDRWFRRQQASKYTGHISVQMDLSAGMNYGFAGAEANQFITLPEEPTDTERQNAYVQLLDNLTKDFDHNFEASLREHAAWAIMNNR